MQQTGKGMRNQGGLGQVRGELSEIFVSSQPLWSSKQKGFLHCAKSSSCRSTSVPFIAKKAIGFSAAHWQEEEFPSTLPSRPRGRPLYTLSSLPWSKEARALQLLVSPVTVLSDPSSLLSVQTCKFGQDRFHSVTTKAEALHWSVSMVQQHVPAQNISEARKLPVLPAALSADYPWPCCLSLNTHSPPPLSSYYTTPACLTLIPYIWQIFPCNSHPSSKETMQRHLNHPQIPVAGERCSINEAAPTAMRTLISSSAIKNSTRLSLHAESNPFTWRTQPVSVDLWRRRFCIPCASNAWHRDGAVHC